MSATGAAPKPTPILLIEDEPSVAMFVRAALERSGYSVIAVQSGTDALKLLDAGEYFGVISDMRTPGGISGADVHAWLGENRPQLARRLIFITGDIASADTASTLAVTGAPYVEKPFRVQQLIAMVEQTFGRAL